LFILQKNKLQHRKTVLSLKTLPYTSIIRKETVVIFIPDLS